tara:strand:- start:5 stop:718 length:714 start_codon:yes stop_codon:yes gene_type:complete
MSNNDTVHPSIRTNAALVALAQTVQTGKACSVPLAMESGFAILQKEDNLTRYTKAQASKMLTTCRQQAIGATKAAESLPVDIKACLALTYTLKGGQHKGTTVPLWAHALNASTSRYTDAGKAIREARSASIIEATGGFVCEGVDGVFHSRREARKAGLRATYGADWWKRDDVADLRKEFSSKVHKAGEAPATPAPVAEAPTATVMDAQVISIAQAMGSKATTPAGARKFLAARGINL